jgi:hypothetical protein
MPSPPRMTAPGDTWSQHVQVLAHCPECDTVTSFDFNVESESLILTLGFTTSCKGCGSVQDGLVDVAASGG